MRGISVGIDWAVGFPIIKEQAMNATDSIRVEVIKPIIPPVPEPTVVIRLPRSSAQMLQNTFGDWHVQLAAVLHCRGFEKLSAEANDVGSRLYVALRDAGIEVSVK